MNLCRQILARFVAPLLATVLGTMISSQAIAQNATAYVDDRLQVGLHESADLSSAILELLPSGAVLEVLERKGGLARVKIAGGRSGWVDARFLSDEPPGRLRVEELERELAGAQAALADVEAKMVAAAQSAAESSAPGSGEGDTQAISSDALREMQSLAEENQRLKQQLAELEAVQRMSQEQVASAKAREATVAAAPPAEPSPLSTEGMLPRGRLQTWHLLLVASILLLAFSAGGWLVDWGIRRRHGGFRV